MARKNKALKNKQKQQRKLQKKQTKQKKKQINKTYKQEKRAAKKKKKYDKKQLKQQAKAQTNYDVDAPALSDTIDSATDAIDNISTATREISSTKKKKSLAEKMNNAKQFASNLLNKANKAKDFIISNNPLKKQQEINLDDMSDNSTNSGMSTQSTSTEEEGFFSKYKIPLIIGGTLLTIGGVVFALTRNSAPPKKGKLSGIDDDDGIGDIEPIELS